MKKHYRQEKDCLNCGTILEGKFCHVCGQENLEIKESFGHMMNHAISDYFHFDHQFFHTLKPLLFRPGFLTNEYMAGRRAQYLHPVKMYIFISIVYFLLLFKSSSETEVVKVTNDPKKPNTETVANTIAHNPNLSTTQKKQLIEKVNRRGIGKDTVSENFKKGYMTLTTDSSYSAYLTHQEKLPDEKKDGWIERVLNKKAFDYKTKYGERSREVFYDEFKHNIPKMMFALLPLFALILKITFFRGKKYYVEHLIYAFHFHCFLFIFLAFIMLLNMALGGNHTITEWVALAATIYIIWYIYKSLRVVYHRSVFRTITKIIGMYMAYFAVSVCCIIMVVLLTAIVT